jgi:hypothetical protein
VGKEKSIHPRNQRSHSSANNSWSLLTFSVLQIYLLAFFPALRFPPPVSQSPHHTVARANNCYDCSLRPLLPAGYLTQKLSCEQFLTREPSKATEKDRRSDPCFCVRNFRNTEKIIDLPFFLFLFFFVPSGSPGLLLSRVSFLPGRTTSYKATSQRFTNSVSKQQSFFVTSCTSLGL